MKKQYTVDLNKVSMDDLPLVGGKNASLGEMIQNLKNDTRSNYINKRARFPYSD